MNSDNQRFYTLAADAVVLLHFAYVLFIVLGFVVIWLGYFFKWRFVRNRWFRSLHMFSMGVVLVEALFGITCPLTTWENNLRQLAGEGTAQAESFMQQWVHRLMFFNLGPSTFTMIYAGVFILIVLTYWVVRPEWSKRN